MPIAEPLSKMRTRSRNAPVRVLLDGRVDGADGIGRYTRAVISALENLASTGIDVQVLRPTGTRRYCQDEGAELMARARLCRADLIHVLDYRVPVVPDAEIPLVVTVHDVLRVLRPEFCYSDPDFEARFGIEGFTGLQGVTSDLRELAGFPGQGIPASTHEEFLGRMLTLAVHRARALITPTAVVARQLCDIIPAHPKVRVSPWGIDHLPPAGSTFRFDMPPSYLLYVGQARPHKGMPELLEAVARSTAYRDGAHLVLAGRDFAPGSPAAMLAREFLGTHCVHPVGEVSDGELAALYTYAAALLHLSEHEGFGFPPLEALAHGCPVVASDIPVLRETLGHSAAFADPHDPDDVAHRLHDLLAADGPQARADRARWASQFRWQRHAEDLSSCYRSVLHGS